MTEFAGVGFILKQINDKLGQYMNNELQPFGLTMTQSKFLRFLNSRKGMDTSQKDIEDYFDIAHSTVIGVLKRLEQKELIGFVDDPKDRRKKLVILLPAEQEIHEQVKRAKKRIDEQMLKGMTQDQIEALEQTLKQLHNNILDLTHNNNKNGSCEI
ncbi:MarR family transcriptional regulator [uncultured Cohaesibacter sp.]|uniref:MarR family winged helix-turn-helix transcriptional regulator n=1 Tax=uncultured Cohaesibacter sp. TaxID=1002546 RepID=UPI002AA64926|nr:MarR family transcriptional regulator [uncultured Cohaesibacter sp.]